MLKLFVCVFCTFVLQNVWSKEDSDITKLMKAANLIPDVVDNGPKDLLKITYENNVMVTPGKELTPTQVKKQPLLEWKAEPNSFYMLTMTNPDAPCHLDPKLGEWDHWLVGNIPGNDIAKGDVLAQYVGALPPESSGLHRYIFLIFKQPRKLAFDEARLTNHSAKGRGQFSTKKFITKYTLGEPVAGNFFTAQFDTFVLELYKQLFSVE